MGRTTRTAERREAILTAALRLFTDQGLAATSIDQIRVESGASIGSIYHHFGSKEAIAATLYADAIESWQQGAIEVLGRANTPADGIRGIVRHFLIWVGEHPDLASLMLRIDAADVRALASDRLRDLNRSFLPKMRVWAEEQMDTGAMKRLPRDLLVPTLLAPAHRFATAWLDGATSTPLDEASRILGDLAWEALRGSATGGRPPRARRNPTL